MCKKICVLLLGICLTVVSFQGEQGKVQEDLSEYIGRLIKGIDLIPQMGPEDSRGYILLMAESILYLAPQVDIPEDIQAELEESVDAYKNVDKVILREDSVDSLWKAGRFLDPDFDLDFPENATREIIKEDIRLELHLALSFLDLGQLGRVEEILLRSLLRIITPVKRNNNWGQT